VLIGNPKTIVTPASNDKDDDVVQVLPSAEMGVLEDAVLHTFPFKRACMGCQDDEGQIGYDNLVSKVQPPFWQLSIMVAIVALLSIGWWILVCKVTLFERRPVYEPLPDYRQYRKTKLRQYN
jgi:hypothetical protein